MSSDVPPVVNGLSTTLHTLTPHELRQWPLLAPLVHTINTSFAHTHTPHILPRGTLRLDYPTQLADVLDPSAFTHALVQGGTVVGTVSEDAAQDGARTIRFLAVDPSLHRQGIGGWLLKLAEEGSARRAGRDVRMVIDTVKEVNVDFYSRRGWSVVREEVFPAGTANSPNGFTVVYMEKVVGNQAG